MAARLKPTQGAMNRRMSMMNNKTTTTERNDSSDEDKVDVAHNLFSGNQWPTPTALADQDDL